MRKILVKWSVPCAIFLLASIGSPRAASAQPVPWHINQGSDGTLYLVTGDTRYVVNPDAISDDSLAGLIDGGVLGSQLPMPIAIAAQVITVDATSTPLPATAAPLPPTNTPVPSSSTPLPPTAIPTPVPEPPATVSGAGNVKSRPFPLRGGNYTITWTLSTNDSCFIIGGDLRSADPPDNGSASLMGQPGNLTAGHTSTGETQAYNLPTGQYYVAAYSSCNWTVTVKPQ